MENKANILLNFQASTNEAAEKIKQASEQAGKDLENGIKNGAKRGADQASKSIKKVGIFDELKNVFKGIKSGKIDVVASVAGATGGGAGEGLNLNGVISILGSLGSQLGLIGTGIGIVTSLVQSYFKTKEARQQNKAQSAGLDNQLHTARIVREQEAQAVDNKLMDQLEGLAKQTGLTASEMQRAMKIISELNRRYPYAAPSARVNMDKGTIQGFQDYQGLVKNEQAYTLEKEFTMKMQAMKAQQRLFMEANIADPNDSNFKKYMARKTDWSGEQKGALYRNAYKTLEAMYAKKDPARWKNLLSDQSAFNKEARDIYEQDQFVMSQIKNAKDLGQAYIIAQQAYKSTLDTDAKRKKALYQIMEMLQQQMTVEKKINDARQAGLKKLQLEKALRAEQEKRRVLTEEQQKQDTIIKNVQDSDLQHRYSQLDNDSDREQFIWDNYMLPRMGKVSNLEAENENLRGKTYASDKQRATDAQRLAQIEQQLKQAGLDQKTKEKLEEQRTQLKTKVYGDQSERAKDTMTIARNETQILRLKGEIFKFQQQRTALIERQNKEYTREYDNMKEELEVERLILRGRYEQARILKHMYQMKNKGMGYDPQQEKQLEKMRKKQDAMKFKKYLRGEAYNTLDNMTPKTFWNDYQKKIREWEWANQTKMTTTQRGNLYDVMQHQYSQITLNRMKTDLQNDISRSEIKTNDLTARGGFVGGAVEPPLAKINNNITTFQNMVNNNMAQLRALMQRLGII